MNQDWSKWGFWVGIISLLLAILFFIFTKLLSVKSSELEFINISKSRIFTINEEVSGLSIIYKNEDLKKNKKNLTVFTLRIINTGNLPILKEYFDDNLSYGIILKNGYLVNEPEIVESSNSNYFSNVIKYFRFDSIAFNELIFNPKDFFDIKFLVVHFEKDNPDFNSFGMIANQSEITISTFEEPKEKESKSFSWIFTIVGVSGLFILISTSYTRSKMFDLHKKEIERIRHEKTQLQEILLNKFEKKKEN